MLIIDSPHNDISFVGNTLLDNLYAVLHARHMAQAYDKTYLAKVEQAAKSLKDDDLYKSDKRLEADVYRYALAALDLVGK